MNLPWLSFSRLEKDQTPYRKQNPRHAFSGTSNERDNHRTALAGLEIRQNRGVNLARPLLAALPESA
jgi:hypothetical protein